MSASAVASSSAVSKQIFSAPTDWTLCALCQKHTKEKLQCPAKNSNTNKASAGSSYTTVAENLLKFAQLGCELPVHLEQIRSDEDASRLEQTFVNNEAKFHQKCRYRYNNTQLKRKAASLQSAPSYTESTIPDVDENTLLPTPSKLPRRRFTSGS